MDIGLFLDKGGGRVLLNGKHVAYDLSRPKTWRKYI